MFSDAELRTAREEQRRAMADVCQAETPPERIPDGSGGNYLGEPGLGEPMPCRKGTLGDSPLERRLAEQDRPAGLELLVLAWDAPVSLSSVLRYTHKETGQVQRFKVVGIPQATVRIVTRCIVEAL